MRPYVAVFDNFFDDLNAEVMWNFLTLSHYEDVVSEADGVTYPGILTAFPNGLRELIEKKLAFCVGEKIKVKTLFARLTSSQQLPAPNQIHSDKIMGQGAALIYMSKNPPPESGTSFWSDSTSDSEYHLPGMNEERLQRNSNDRSEWDQTNFVAGKFNRLLLYDARLWHCAEPVGGFGSGPKDGRIVLTAFFDYVR